METFMFILQVLLLTKSGRGGLTSNRKGHYISANAVNALIMTNNNP